MGEYVKIVRSLINGLPTQATVLILTAAVVALTLYTVDQLSALSSRVDLTERASVVLLCRAGEVDAKRDPAACWYFMQGQEDQFKPPTGWRDAENRPQVTVP